MIYRVSEHWGSLPNFIHYIFFFVTGVLSAVTSPTEQIQYDTIICPTPELNHTGYIMLLHANLDVICNYTDNLSLQGAAASGDPEWDLLHFQQCNHGN